MRRVSLHNRNWAVGLQWNLNNLKLGIPELRRTARKEDPSLDMVAFRQRQYAFGASHGDFQAWRGVRALASSIQVASSSFVGLFCLEDAEGQFWWVFAMSQSIVVGMGDQVFSTREDAEASIQSLRGLLDSDFEESVICGTVEDSLKWLSPLVPSILFALPSKSGGSLIPLHPVPSQQRNRIVATVTVLLLLAGVYGLKLFLEHQAGKKAVEATRAAMLNKEQRRREILANPEQHFQRPWMAAPDMREAIRAGLKTMLSLPMVASGWVLEGATFDGQAVNASWGHRPGADYTHLPLGARLENPQKAISRIPVPKVSRLQGTPSVLPREDCTKRLYACTQAMGARLKLTFHAQEKMVIEDVEVVCPWLRGQWELSDVPAAVVLDGSLPEAFIKMPGLMLDSMVQEKGSWTFKGAIYAIPR